MFPFLKKPTIKVCCRNHQPIKDPNHGLARFNNKQLSLYRFSWLLILCPMEIGSYTFSNYVQLDTFFYLKCNPYMTFFVKSHYINTTNYQCKNSIPQITSAKITNLIKTKIQCKNYQCKNYQCKNTTNSSNSHKYPLIDDRRCHHRLHIYHPALPRQ